ncbi:D-alanine--D-alanine ligase [Vampirovibrio sp.]|uniref:D-alanine--D-alanine ligase n=1 Tax=Vampirovibrio sp. TaxID=2717857 RepID=UPI0035948D16
MTSTQQNQILNKHTRIGVLYGGLSSEREVSLRSGKNCYDALRRLGYEQAELIDVDQTIARTLSDKKIEVAYIALHGKYGEDGCIQGVLELMGVPYTGCRVAASALTMNKALTKSVLKDAGLPVIDSVVLKSSVLNGKPVPMPLRYPVMVKPINEGSSIGMSKVDQPDDLKAALKTAFTYADEVMVEQYVYGKSLTVGVVEVGGEPNVTPILELRPTQSEWYDLEAKYTEGGTEFILPAELDEPTTQAIQDATLLAHLAAGCRGVSRIDFVVDADNQFYILEINTIPGMTNLSDLPAQAKAMGIGYDELVECILKTAVS